MEAQGVEDEVRGGAGRSLRAFRVFFAYIMFIKFSLQFLVYLGVRPGAL